MLQAIVARNRSEERPVPEQPQQRRLSPPQPGLSARTLRGETRECHHLCNERSQIAEIDSRATSSTLLPRVRHSRKTRAAAARAAPSLQWDGMTTPLFHHTLLDSK